ncbi:MAG: hypothetical protein Q9204_004363, partial [Flavoplaca sp. TL-2023a]
VAPEIETRMAQYEDGQIEFAILSLVKEPLIKLVDALAENVKSIASIRQRLHQMESDRAGPQSDSTAGDELGEQSLILGPCEKYRLSQEAIDHAVLSPEHEELLKSGDGVAMSAIVLDLTTAQASIRASIRDEIKAIQTDDDRAASRRNDKGLLAKGLLQVVERMGRLRIFMESACCS